MFTPGYRPLSESQVYDKVVELFRDQPQLLAEFSQFLPDAGSGSSNVSTFFIFWARFVFVLYFYSVAILHLAILHRFQNRISLV